jgi:hypothetical protein
MKVRHAALITALLLSTTSCNPDTQHATDIWYFTAFPYEKCSKTTLQEIEKGAEKAALVPDVEQITLKTFKSFYNTKTGLGLFAFRSEQGYIPTKWLPSGDALADFIYMDIGAGQCAIAITFDKTPPLEYKKRLGNLLLFNIGMTLPARPKTPNSRIATIDSHGNLKIGNHPL